MLWQLCVNLLCCGHVSMSNDNSSKPQTSSWPAATPDLVCELGSSQLFCAILHAAKLSHPIYDTASARDALRLSWRKCGQLITDQEAQSQVRHRTSHRRRAAQACIICSRAYEFVLLGRTASVHFVAHACTWHVLQVRGPSTRCLPVTATQRRHLSQLCPTQSHAQVYSRSYAFAATAATRCTRRKQPWASTSCAWCRSCGRWATCC